LLARRSTRGK